MLPVESELHLALKAAVSGMEVTDVAVWLSRRATIWRGRSRGRSSRGAEPAGGQLLDDVWGTRVSP